MITSYFKDKSMSKSDSIEGVVWTPQMPDRRKGSRRGHVRHVKPNGQLLKVSSEFLERRCSNDRRNSITVTITGRAIEVVH